MTIADRRRADNERQRRRRHKQADELATLRDAVERNRDAGERLQHVARQLRTMRETITTNRPAARGVVMKTEAGIALHALLTFVENQLDDLTRVCDVTAVRHASHSGRDPMGGIDLRLLTTSGKASTR